MKYLIIIFSLILPFFCNAQISRNLYSTSGDMVFERNQNFVLFKNMSKISFSRDREKGIPLKFEIKLPENMKKWGEHHSFHFRFHYKNSEGIFIKTQLFDKISLPDSVYIPSQDEVLDMISYDYIELHYPRLDRRNWRLLEKGKILNNKKRKTILIQKYDSKILLFNIKEKNFEEYYSLVESFRPLPE